MCGWNPNPMLAKPCHSTINPYERDNTKYECWGLPEIFQAGFLARARISAPLGTEFPPLPQKSGARIFPKVRPPKGPHVNCSVRGPEFWMAGRKFGPEFLLHTPEFSGGRNFRPYSAGISALWKSQRSYLDTPPLYKAFFPTGKGCFDQLSLSTIVAKL